MFNYSLVRGVTLYYRIAVVDNFLITIIYNMQYRYKIFHYFCIGKIESDLYR